MNYDPNRNTPTAEEEYDNIEFGVKCTLEIKNFALLSHPSLLRCSHISYAPLLAALFPRNARFLLRTLCRQSASILCIWQQFILI